MNSGWISDQQCVWSQTSRNTTVWKFTLLCFLWGSQVCKWSMWLNRNVITFANNNSLEWDLSSAHICRMFEIRWRGSTRDPKKTNSDLGEHTMSHVITSKAKNMELFLGFLFFCSLAADSPAGVERHVINFYQRTVFYNGNCMQPSQSVPGAMRG